MLGFRQIHYKILRHPPQLSESWGKLIQMIHRQGVKGLPGGRESDWPAQMNRVPQPSEQKSVSTLSQNIKTSPSLIVSSSKTPSRTLFQPHNPNHVDSS